MKTLDWARKHRPPCGATAVKSDILLKYLKRKKNKTNGDINLMGDVEKSIIEYDEQLWIELEIIKLYEGVV